MAEKKPTHPGSYEPYFADELKKGAAHGSAAPNVMFIDFLSRLSGPARVDIDPRQEMLILALQNRVLRFALSAHSDDVVLALNQLCAIYHQCVIKAGLKGFEVFAVQNDQYIKIQEQVYYSHKQAAADGQRPIQKTTNLLTYAHDLLEGLIRRLTSLAVFALDVIRGRDRFETLTPIQYVELDLRTKQRRFAEDPGIVRRTHDLIFGAVRHDVRNAIAHKRYEIQEDGCADLWDYDPYKQTRKPVGRLTQTEISDLVSTLEVAVAVLEMSALIFQHNNGVVLHELGHYGGKEEYSEKQMREMIYLSAPGAFMRVEKIGVKGGQVTITAAFLSFESSSSPSEVFVSSADASGKPRKYALPIPPRELSARDQTLRLLQIASMYCKRYERITVITEDALGGRLLGKVTAETGILFESSERKIPKEEFLKRLAENTFPEQ